MTHYTMNLILEQWVKPRFDISQWEFYDLSCVNRDNTEDQVLHDAVAAGSRICAIFKEPTVTPTEIQKNKLNLKKTWGSPNGAMRRGWNGITISRDTIHIEGMELGYKRPVLFERHAVGGEYGAGYNTVGAGRLVTIFHPEDHFAPHIIDARSLTDSANAVVTYHNPLDNVYDLAHHFFKRCLEARVTPYVVTKKTVFKWQEGFWDRFKEVYDEHYKEAYAEAGMPGELKHLISDAATMQLVRWTDGGFGMAAHNYDGDMLTDEIAQVHRSPGFITSNLMGRRDDGVLIKEFEASHGTVADMWEDHLEGKETSLNPLGMVEALTGAMTHAASLTGGDSEVEAFATRLRKTMHHLLVTGKGTRDLCGPEGLTTEAFVTEVAKQLDAEDPPDTREIKRAPKVDRKLDSSSIRALFNEFDTKKNGVIDFEEFVAMAVRLNIQPRTAHESSDEEETDPSDR